MNPRPANDAATNDNAREPAWVRVARALIGTREHKGPASNPAIIGWAKALTARVLGIAYTDDAVPWCGLFVAHCVAAAGLAPPKIAIRASAWDSWGIPTKPRIGAILRFARDGGGHVGIYVGEDESAYHVLGGNQSDAVTITRIAKVRLVACRWPAGVPMTTTALTLTAGGGALSRNEA